VSADMLRPHEQVIVVIAMVAFGSFFGSDPLASICLHVLWMVPTEVFATFAAARIVSLGLSAKTFLARSTGRCSFCKSFTF